MAEREKYYYIFRYVDGTEQEFEQDDSVLTSMISNPDRKRIHVGNVIINLDNVIKVTVEKQSERDEFLSENLEVISDLNF